jgi:hypothetical protein
MSCSVPAAAFAHSRVYAPPLPFNRHRHTHTRHTCRQPTLEEREFLEEEALGQDRLAIKLERLHFDGRSG